MKLKILSILVIGLFLGSSVLPNITSISANGLGSLDDNLCYGFIIKVNAVQSFDLEIQNNISRLINELLGENASVYWICSDINVSTKDLNGEDNVVNRLFEKGSFIVSFTDDPFVDAMATSKVYDYNLSKNVEIYQLMESLSDVKVYILVEPKIAHFDLDSITTYASYVQMSEGGFKNQAFLKPQDILDNLNTNDYNVCIIGGTISESFTSGSNLLCVREALDPKVRLAKQKIKDFVKKGGGYIGFCHGANMAASGFYTPPCAPQFDLEYMPLRFLYDNPLKIIDRQTYRGLPGYGSLILKCVNSDNPVAFGVPQILNSFAYYSSPMFREKRALGETSTEDLFVLEDIDPNNWKWDISVNTPSWMLLPEKIKDKKIENWFEYSKGKALAVTDEFGEGKVVAFGGHPEYAAWPPHENFPTRVLHNSIFYVTSKGPFDIEINKGRSVSNLNVDANGPYIGTTTNSLIYFNGSIIGDNSLYTLIWNFGDGEISTEQNPQHKYDVKHPKSFNVILSVANEDSIGVDTAVVSIKPGLKAQVFPAYCHSIMGDEIQIYDRSYGGFPSYTWEWDFGDGNISTLQNPIHSYDEVGIYYGTLSVTDEKNDMNKCSFVSAVNKHCSFSSHLEVNTYHSTANVTVGLKAYIDSQDDGITRVYTYEFSFGDDSDPIIIGPTEENTCYIEHNYSDLGTYFPTVSVLSGGDTSYAATGVIVNNRPPNKPSKPIGLTQGRPGMLYKYWTTATDPDGDLLQIGFDFGDGKDIYWVPFWERYAKEFQRTTVIFNDGQFYKWTKTGTYQVRAIARDDPNGDGNFSDGALSPWSDPLNVTISRGFNFF